MSAQLPGISSGQIGGITGIDGSSQGASDVELGQKLGEMGAMQLLSTSRALNVHFNSIGVALALEQREKDSVKNVIASM